MQINVALRLPNGQNDFAMKLFDREIHFMPAHFHCPNPMRIRAAAAAAALFCAQAQAQAQAPAPAPHGAPAARPAPAAQNKTPLPPGAAAFLLIHANCDEMAEQGSAAALKTYAASLTKLSGYPKDHAAEALENFYRDQCLGPAGSLAALRLEIARQSPEQIRQALADPSHPLRLKAKTARDKDLLQAEKSGPGWLAPSLPSLAKPYDPAIAYRARSPKALAFLRDKLSCARPALREAAFKNLPAPAQLPADAADRLRRVHMRSFASACKNDPALPNALSLAMAGLSDKELQTLFEHNPLDEKIPDKLLTDPLRRFLQDASAAFSQFQRKAAQEAAQATAPYLFP